MLRLKNTYQTNIVTTRSLAKQVFEDLSKLSPADQVLDFTGVEFASRSFMVQLYSMLARVSSQARFENMNEEVSGMLEIAIRVWNRPATMPIDTPDKDLPQTVYF